MKYLRLIGQRLFLRLEKIFNAVFGDRLNPLYRLGAIAYFMTWVLVLSFDVSADVRRSPK